MYSPEKTRYLPKACSSPAWNSLRQPGLNGVDGSNRVQSKQRIQDRVAAPDAGKHQVFIERSFQSARVGNAKNRVGRLDVVSDAEREVRLAGVVVSPL